jgi:hypothetical protein
MIDEEVQQFLHALDKSRELDFAAISTLVLALDVTRFGTDNKSLVREARQLGLDPEDLLLTEVQLHAIKEHLIALLSSTEELPAHWVLWLFAKTGSDRALETVQHIAETFLAGVSLDARLAEEIVGYFGTYSGRAGVRPLLDRLGADPRWPASDSLRSLMDMLQR